MAVPTDIPTNSVGGLPFLHTLSRIYYFVDFLMMAILTGVVLIFISGAVVICLPMQKMQEMWAWSLGWEDALEWEMATHSSILEWKVPWTEEPGRL